ncbi:MAG: YajG family lipoprotein [Betaproteobacteria bacterium]
MNAKFLLATAVVSLTLALQGCSLKQQTVRIDPEVKVQDSQVGNNVVIGLRVSDGRTDKKLGEVGDPNIKMVDVRTEEDPSPAIYGRVKQALTRLGYTVQPFDESMGRTLDITVNKLELQSVKKPLTFDTELRAEVTAHAVNAKTYYDRQFNVRTRKDGAAPPYEKDSTALVNTALSQALEDLLSDDKLLALLAK